jgi:hypothetical protein
LHPLAGGEDVGGAGPADDGVKLSGGDGTLSGGMGGAVEVMEHDAVGGHEGDIEYIAG